MKGEIDSRQRHPSLRRPHPSRSPTCRARISAGVVRRVRRHLVYPLPPPSRPPRQDRRATVPTAPTTSARRRREDHERSHARRRGTHHTHGHPATTRATVSYTHLRAHETPEHL